MACDVTLPPVSLGPYRAIDVLGRGGMGVVYRAVHHLTGEEVAVKLASAHPCARAALRREVEIFVELCHPRIMRMLEHGEADGGPWYAMERMHGQSLRALNVAARRPAVEGPISLPRPLGGSATWSADSAPDPRCAAAARPTGKPSIPRPMAGDLTATLTLYRRLCVPLSVMHAHGFVHCDLKPSNVMIRRDGIPVLVDLGVTAAFRRSDGRARLDDHDGRAGTPRYMAPEQAGDRPVDGRADLYALGCMLYESLTGHLPRTADAAAVCARDAPVVPPSALVEGLPAALDALVLRLLEPDPRRRIAHLQDVAEALNRLGAAADEGCVGPPPLYVSGIVGREAEMARMDETLDRVAAGASAVVLLEGESGMGKTRLASQVRGRARRGGFRVIIGETLIALGDAAGDAPSTGPSLHPLGRLVSHLAATLEQASPDERARIGGPDLAALLGYVPAFAPFASPVGALAGGNPDAAWPQVCAALHRLVEGWVRHQGPLLLVLDDLQWADEPTLAWIRHCARHPVARLCILGTLRSASRRPPLAALLAEPAVQRIELDRLGRYAIAELVADMLAESPAPAALVDRLVAVSEGNPLFVGEFLRMAVHSGHLHRAGGRWRTPDAGTERALPVPPSIRVLIAQRLAALDPAARAVAEALAVLGEPASQARIATLCVLADQITARGGASGEAMPGDHIGRALSVLCVRGVLERGADAYRFVHHALLEGTHADIEPVLRRAMHRRAAELIEADAAAHEATPHGLLARHWRLAGDLTQAIAHLEAAAEAAYAIHANYEVVEHLAAALRLAERVAPPVESLRCARWHALSGQAREKLGHFALALVHGRRALALVGERPLAGNRWSQALDIAREALTWALRPIPRSPHGEARRHRIRVAARVHACLIDSLLMDADVLLAVYCSLRAVRLGQLADMPREIAYGRVVLAMMISYTPFRRTSLRWLHDAIAVAGRAPEPDALRYACAHGANITFGFGDWALTDNLLRQALAVATRARDHRRADEARLALGMAALLRGTFTEAARNIAQVLASSAERGDPQLTTWSRLHLVECSLRLDRTADVASHHRSEPPDKGSSAEHFWGEAVAAAAALYLGDVAEAAGRADAAIAAGRQAPLFGFFLVSPMALLAETCIALWARDRVHLLARARVEAALRFLRSAARVLPLARPLDRLWHGVWSVRRGRLARGRRLLHRAAEAADALASSHTEGLAWLELAAVAPSPAERAAALGRAKRCLETSGALRDLQRIHHAERASQRPYAPPGGPPTEPKHDPRPRHIQ